MLHVLDVINILVVGIVLISPPYAMAFAGGWGPKRQQQQQQQQSTILSGRSSKLQVQCLSDVVDGEQQQITEQTTTTTTAITDQKVKTSDILSLNSIRSTLIRQEETIIFAIIERAQFRQNLIVYEKGGFGNMGNPPGSSNPPVTDDDDDEILSFMEYMLVGTETLHCG